MISALVIIGQCVMVTPAALPDQPQPQWQGRVAYRTDDGDGFGVAPIDRSSTAVVVQADRVAPCELKVAGAK